MPTTDDNVVELRPAAPGGAESWRDLANCVGIDPDLFFPARGESIVDARQVCACQVRIECLEYALDNHEAFGIWGGLSERERRRIRGQRRRARRDAEMAGGAS